MAFTPNFTAAQNLGTLSNVLFSDTSVGSDPNFTSKRIYCRLANGNWLTSSGESTTEVYETWAIGSATKTIALLSRSICTNITVKWMTGSTATYEKIILNEFDLYDYVFGLQLASDLTSAPQTAQDFNFWLNLWTFAGGIWMSENCVTVGNDLYSGQANLDRNYNMIQNQTKLF